MLVTSIFSLSYNVFKSFVFKVCGNLELCGKKLNETVDSKNLNFAILN